MHILFKGAVFDGSEEGITGCGEILTGGYCNWIF